MAQDMTNQAKESKAAASGHRRDWLLEEWLPGVPWLRMPWVRDWTMPEMRVDELREGDDWVVRAELPGIDPEKDLELTVRNGVLTIAAERKEEERSEHDGCTRREIRFGSLSRSLSLPPGVREDAIHATYEHGILEIRVPGASAEKVTKVAVTKS